MPMFALFKRLQVWFKTKLHATPPPVQAEPDITVGEPYNFKHEPAGSFVDEDGPANRPYEGAIPIEREEGRV